MDDLIKRADAIDALSRSSIYAWTTEQDQTAHNWALNIINEIPSADAVGEKENDGFNTCNNNNNNVDADYKSHIRLIDNAPSADAVHGWRIGKPTEQGKYMVTLVSFGHKHIDLFYYGKPMMPNRKVRGMCWHRSDDEWGDVVYDDTDILAWQPLPKPYKGGDDE